MANGVRRFLFAVFKLLYVALARTPLRRWPGMLALSNVFFRWVWPGGNILEIQDSKMFVNVFDPNPALRAAFQAYALHGVHEKTTTKLFRRVVQPNSVVLDLGANMGYFTLIAARATGPRGAVISFEPEPKNFWYITKNVEINDLKQVTLHRKAVSDRNGQTKLYVCDYDSGHHTINRADGIKAIAHGRAYSEKSIDVDTVRVDDFLREHKIGPVSVIKMDLEGAEALAIAGMRDTLLASDLCVFVEYYPLLLTSMGSDPKEFINTLLSDFGFSMYAIGREHDLVDEREELVSIKRYEQLSSLLMGPHDHVNILLTKRPVEFLLSSER